MFIRLTPDQFRARAARLQEDYQILIAKNAGTIGHSGVTVEYEYDGVDCLSLNVIRKPLLVSEKFVEDKLREWFAAPAG